MVAGWPGRMDSLVVSVLKDRKRASGTVFRIYRIKVII